MTKAFKARVNREGIVDTKKYRYATYQDMNAGGLWKIRRIELNKLDTTAAYTDWEDVCNA